MGLYNGQLSASAIGNLPGPGGQMVSPFSRNPLFPEIPEY